MKKLMLNELPEIIRELDRKSTDKSAYCSNDRTAFIYIKAYLSSMYDRVNTYLLLKENVDTDIEKQFCVELCNTYCNSNQYGSELLYWTSEILGKKSDTIQLYCDTIFNLNMFNYGYFAASARQALKRVFQ